MKLLFISLGCDKNLVDSEVMLGLIRRKGYEITNEEREAEVIVVNTCCFVNDAKEESIATLLEMARLKEDGKAKVLLAAGCLAQRYKDEIQKEIPEVDGILGTTGYEEIVSAIEEALEGKRPAHLKDIDYLPKAMEDRVLTTGGYYSYLKIAEGCDKHCTYCIIPKIRGKYRSIPMEELVRQAGVLAEKGVVELSLVAQETTRYGVDLYGKKMLPELLRKLCQIEGLRWIRILYCYPEEITEELLMTIRQEEKICKYLDMPIQHASDPVLKKMGRRTNRRELEATIAKIRELVPGITLRTTLISGFPGETQEDHQSLLSFVREQGFDRLGVFAYSQEEDTPAAAMEGQLEEEVKEARRDEIMAAQQEIAFHKAQEKIAQTVTVLVEGVIPEDGVYIGRTQGDAPDVDGYLFFSSSHELISGDMVRVLVTDAKGYDLVGELA